MSKSLIRLVSNTALRSATNKTVRKSSTAGTVVIAAVAAVGHVLTGKRK